MGKTYTPAYRAEYRDQQGWHVMSWEVRSRYGMTAHGAPTEANAEKLRRALNRSFRRDGVNAHVADLLGFVPHVSAVRIVRQDSGRVVVDVRAPMFEVV